MKRLNYISELLMETDEAIKKGLENVDQQIYDAIHTLNN